MPAALAPRTLRDLSRGQVAVVEDVCDCVEGCHRLASLGIACGAVVEMLQPGAPCAVQVGNCRLVLRGEQVGRIHVSLLD